jgi:hypothetical protein
VSRLAPADEGHLGRHDVMNWTLASKGRFAMKTIALATYQSVGMQ